MIVRSCAVVHVTRGRSAGRRCHREVGVNKVDERDVLYKLFMLLSVLTMNNYNGT